MSVLDPPHVAIGDWLHPAQSRIQALADQLIDEAFAVAQTNMPIAREVDLADALSAAFQTLLSRSAFGPRAAADANTAFGCNMQAIAQGLAWQICIMVAPQDWQGLLGELNARVVDLAADSRAAEMQYRKAAGHG